MNFNYAAFQDRLASIPSAKDRAIALVESTAGFYNLGNRAKLVLNRDIAQITCFYHPTDTTPGCAIGRCLDRTSMFVDPLFKGDDTDVATLLSAYPEEFPDWLKEISVEILIRLQEFHDDDRNWDEFGLTAVGAHDKQMMLALIESEFKSK